MAKDDPGGREDSAAAPAGSVCPPSLLIGFFDPIDGRAVAEAARLSLDGPVRAVILGDGFGRFDDVLSCAEDRCEIVRHVRGISSVILARDAETLDGLLRRLDPGTTVQWLDGPPESHSGAATRPVARRTPLPNTV